MASEPQPLAGWDGALLCTLAHSSPGCRRTLGDKDAPLPSSKCQSGFKAAQTTWMREAARCTREAFPWRQSQGQGVQAGDRLGGAKNSGQRRGSRCPSPPRPPPPGLARL